MNDERFYAAYDAAEKRTQSPELSWQDKRAALMAGGYSKGDSRAARRKQERKEAKLRKKAA